MNSVKTKQMKYTADAKLIMPVNKCSIIEKFTECKDESEYRCAELSKNRPKITCDEQYYKDNCKKTCKLCN